MLPIFLLQFRAFSAGFSASFFSLSIFLSVFLSVFFSVSFSSSIFPPLFFLCQFCRLLSSDRFFLSIFLSTGIPTCLRRSRRGAAQIAAKVTQQIRPIGDDRCLYFSVCTTDIRVTENSRLRSDVYAMHIVTRLGILPNVRR